MSRQRTSETDAIDLEFDTMMINAGISPLNIGLAAEEEKNSVDQNANKELLTKLQNEMALLQKNIAVIMPMLMLVQEKHKKEQQEQEYLKFINDFPSLSAFFNHFEKMLSSLFLACKVLSTDMVGFENKVTSVSNAIGNIFSILTLGFSELFSLFMNGIYAKNKMEGIHKIANLLSLSTAYEPEIRYAAIQLTLRFQLQIQQTTPDEKGAKKLAAFAAVCILNALGKNNFSSDMSLGERLVQGALSPLPATLASKLENEKIATTGTEKKNWTAHGIFFRSSLMILPEIIPLPKQLPTNATFYCSKTARPEKYGIRLALLSEIPVKNKETKAAIPTHTAATSTTVTPLQHTAPTKPKVEKPKASHATHLRNQSQTSLKPLLVNNFVSNSNHKKAATVSQQQRHQVQRETLPPKKATSVRLNNYARAHS